MNNYIVDMFRYIVALALVLVVSSALSITSRPTNKPVIPTYSNLNHGAQKPTSNMTKNFP